MKRAWLALLPVACVAPVLADEVTSGPKEGAHVSAFHVHDITGPNKGKALCYVWQNGNKPSVLVFARKTDDNLASFAKRLDDLVAKNQDKEARGTVVLLGKKDDFSSKLETIAKDKKIAQVPLTVSVDGDKGPKQYQVNKNVNFTVVVYNKDKVVTASLAFDKLDAKQQDEALAAFAKVLGVDPPKSSGDSAKEDTKKDDTKKADAPKKDDSTKKDPD